MRRCKGDVVGKIGIGALNKFFAYRYDGTSEGWTFPPDDAGKEDLKILLDHYYWTNPLAMPRVIALRAPWMNEADADGVLAQVEAFPRKYRSKTLGRLLGFTGAEWRRLRLRTFAPIDMTAEERRQESQILQSPESSR